MSAVNNSNTVNSNNYLLPKEISTCALGTTIASTSGVAVQFLESYASARFNFPTVVKNFMMYNCYAASVVGLVMSVYSMIHLCRKIISKENELDKAVTATALGVLLTGTIYAIGEHFWDIAPCFDWLEGHSMMYCIGTNMAWQASAVLGFAAIIFTAYAAYRLGQAILATNQQ